MDALQVAAMVVPLGAWALCRGVRLVQGRPTGARAAVIATLVLGVPVAWAWAHFLVLEVALGWLSPARPATMLLVSLAPGGILLGATRATDALAAWPRDAWRWAALGAVAVAGTLALVLWPPLEASDFIGPGGFVGALWLTSGVPLLLAALPRFVATRAAAGTRAGWAGAGAALGVALLMGAFGGSAAVFLTLLEHNPAHQRWRVEIDAAPDEAYALSVPFPLASERSAPVHRLLVKGLAVVDGDVQAHVDLGAGWLRIEGRGPAVVEASTRFYGTTQHRESFHAYGLVDDNVTLAQPPDALIRVRLVVDLSGGSGHTCWSTSDAMAVLDNTTRAGLATDQPWQDHLLQGVCA